MLNKWLLTIIVLLSASFVLGCGDNSATPAQASPLASPSGPTEGNWTIFSDGNHIYNLKLNDNEMWAATSGGAVKWDMQQGSYTKYTAFDGLPGNWIMGTARANDGKLWFATDQGAGGYDGQNFHIISRDLTGQVDAVVKDQQGVIWFHGPVSQAELIRYDGKSWEKVQPQTVHIDTLQGLRHGLSLSSTGLPTRMLVDRDNNIWVIGDYSISRYDGHEWHDFYSGGYWDKSARKADEFMLVTIYSAAADPDGSLWFGTDQGLIHYDGMFSDIIKPQGVPPTDRESVPSRITAMTFEMDGKLLCTVDNYILRYSNDSWQTVSRNSLSSSMINSLTVGTDNNIWCGTDHGIYRFDGQTWQAYLTKDIVQDYSASNVPSNAANAFNEDRQGNIWLATFRGVYRYDGKSWRAFTKADGMADDVASSILADRKGNVWVGTDGFGISRYDGIKWQILTTANGLVSNNVTELYQDKEGNIWVANTDDSLNRFDGRSWQTFYTHDILDNNQDSVTSMFEDSKGNLWFTTQESGVMRYDGTNWKAFTFHNGLASDQVMAISEDSSGNLWFATEKGISRFDGVTWQTIDLPEGTNAITSMVADHYGNVWLGTFGNGVSYYRGASWHTFGADEIGDSSVFIMQEGPEGNLWCGTNGVGVSRYDGKSWTHFTDANGLASNSTLTMFAGRDGSIWFSGYMGVSRYSPG